MPRVGRGFAASPAQRAAVAGHACIVCEADGVDPAHLVSRALGGCDHALCVVPLCRSCHGDYDQHRLNLLPYLEPEWRAQLAHAVEHAGVMGALARIAGPARGTPLGSGHAHAAPARRWEGYDQPPVVPGATAELLSEAEVLALIEACPRRSAGIRNQAMIATLWSCGPRVSELLAVMLADVDLAAGEIILGHGAARRTLGVDGTSAALIGCWLDCRGALGIGDGAPLFCTRSGGPLDPSYLRHLLPRLARKAGIERGVNAHHLRATYAFDLARERATLTSIRDALGHSSRSVTGRYLRRLNTPTRSLA